MELIFKIYLRLFEVILGLSIAVQSVLNSLKEDINVSSSDAGKSETVRVVTLDSFCNEMDPIFFRLVHSEPFSLRSISTII